MVLYNMVLNQTLELYALTVERSYNITKERKNNIINQLHSCSIQIALVVMKEINKNIYLILMKIDLELMLCYIF